MKRPDWFLAGLVLAVALAWSFPGPGAQGGSLHPEVVSKWGVALVFFLHGLTLSFAALVAGARRWRLHLLVQVTTFVLFPLLGLGLHAGLSGALGPAMPEELASGVFFLCALPSTVSSSVALTAAAHGNVAAALFNATLSSLLGVLLTPLWLSAVLGAAGLSLPIGPVMAELLRWLILPLALGQALRPLLAGCASRYRTQIGVLDRSTILLLIYTSFCDSVQAGVWHSGASTLAIASAVCAALLATALPVTWLAGKALGFDQADRIAALFCGSKKSLASGVPMARLIFGVGPHLSFLLLPIIIYHALQLLVGGWLAGRLAAADRQTSSPG